MRPQRPKADGRTHRHRWDEVLELLAPLKPDGKPETLRLLLVDEKGRAFNTGAERSEGEG
ncbi:hypothetical protein [Streptomyces sp. NPDC015242]|uniref:hypothetical protein n=1 Tax=Streptomyces sp. NPDC015242 TaxID=3364951 RepID=UPI0036F920A0